MSAVAACGGSGSESYTGDDIVALLDVAPPLPEGSLWTMDDGITQLSLEEMQRDVKSKPARKSAVDALADAGFRRWFIRTWVSSGAIGQVSAILFPDAAA